MSTLQLRVGPSASHEGAIPGAVADDTPGLLFYYLFDDWSSSYGLVARKEYQYGAELDRMVGQISNLRTRPWAKEQQWLACTYGTKACS